MAKPIGRPPADSIPLFPMRTAQTDVEVLVYAELLGGRRIWVVAPPSDFDPLSSKYNATPLATPLGWAPLPSLLCEDPGGSCLVCGGPTCMAGPIDCGCVLSQHSREAEGGWVCSERCLDSLTDRTESTDG